MIVLNVLHFSFDHIKGKLFFAKCDLLRNSNDSLYFVGLTWLQLMQVFNDLKCIVVVLAGDGCDLLEMP